MGTSQETDPTETPLDPDESQGHPPLSGTVDDADNEDDERWDENEPPDKEIKDRGETLDEFPHEQEEADPGDDLAAEND